MRGMTAYTQTKAADEKYEISLEIHSVNKRHFDVHFRMPKELQSAEIELRKAIAEVVHRGQVSIYVAMRLLSDEENVALNWPWIDSQKRAMQAICGRLGGDVPFDRLAVAVWSSEQAYCENKETIFASAKPLLFKALQDAFVSFDVQRKQEGEAILQELLLGKNTLFSLSQAIKERSSHHVQQIRERLVQLVQEHVPSMPLDDRISREVVLLADKADISEELQRIEHHLQHMGSIFTGDEPCGKMLEFVLQELVREFNTLGSKTIDSEVSTKVILAKNELEKMREQVQNVE